jgi:hypothetical protein
VLTSYAEEIIGDHWCGFDATGQLLIMYSSFFKFFKLNGNTMKQCISCLYLKKTYDSGRR